LLAHVNFLDAFNRDVTGVFSRIVKIKIEEVPKHDETAQQKNGTVSFICLANGGLEMQ
jgi:hypothetical protein